MIARRHKLLSSLTFSGLLTAGGNVVLCLMLCLWSNLVFSQQPTFDLNSAISKPNGSAKRAASHPKFSTKPVLINSSQETVLRTGQSDPALQSARKSYIPAVENLPYNISTKQSLSNQFKEQRIIQVQAEVPPAQPFPKVDTLQVPQNLPPVPMLEQPSLNSVIPPTPAQINDDEVIELHVPIAGRSSENVKLSVQDGKISLTSRGAPLTSVLELIAQESGLNMVASEDVTGNVSVTLNNISLETALNAILSVNGYSWNRQDDIIIVTRLSTESSSLPGVQGRVVRVFDLDFLAATNVQEVIQGLLSPVGKSFVIESSATDKRRTQEQLVVEDLPQYIERIEQYLCQSDIAPRQVLIEAHILQIELSDDMKHGVDFAAILARVSGARIGMNTQGFTNLDDSPAFFLGIEGTDLEGVVEAIQNTTDSKTLASPKVLVVNGQEARIQIGAQLGFLVTTTTQTSTLQQVDFLDTGVVMTVTPHITADNQILMTVKPEVSTGAINPATGLPEEETTEVETTVMLSNGKGMIIGGLIQELDIENQSKIPIIGDLRKVGRLFQKRTADRQRNEIVIALVPRLVPAQTDYHQGLEEEMVRATSPLLGPHLESIDRRPLEPELPDAYLNPRRITLAPIRNFFKRPKPLVPMPIRQEFPPLEGDRTLQGYFQRDPSILGGNTEPSHAPIGRIYHAPVYVPPTPVE